MEIIILVGVLAFGGGWWLGGTDVEVDCKPDPLIITSCIAPTPPASDTFGATTEKLVEVVGQFKACRAACMPEQKMP